MRHQVTDIQDFLRDARIKAIRLRNRVQRPLILGGCSTMLLGITSLIITSFVGLPISLQRPAEMLGYVLLASGTFLGAASSLPNDIRTPYAIACIFSIICILNSVNHAIALGTHLDFIKSGAAPDDCGKYACARQMSQCIKVARTEALRSAFVIVIGFSAVTYFLWKIVHTRALRMRIYLVRATRCTWTLYSAVQLVTRIASTTLGLPPDYAWIMIDFFVTAATHALYRTSVISRVHMRLARTANSTEINSGAVIASFLGETDVQDVTTLARDSFFAVSMDRLTREHIAMPTADPNLHHSLAHRAVLGEVDVFLSHSWMDDEASKWTALQRFREAFKVVHGREPTAWIDKICLSQRDISRYLSCLPVYMSGCRHIVLLAGPTYFMRLWTIVELFTFTEVCGEDPARIAVMLFDAPVPELMRPAVELPRQKRCACVFAAVVSPQSPPSDDAPAWHALDVTSAQCTNAGDRDRLRAALAAGFGDLRALSEKLRTVVERACESDAQIVAQATQMREGLLLDGGRNMTTLSLQRPRRALPLLTSGVVYVHRQQ